MSGCSQSLSWFKYFICYSRSKLGPDLVFVMLEMDLENAVERLSKRHHGDETTTEMMKVVDPLRPLFYLTVFV